ncbi:MAG: hypothetical protein JSV04_06400 [Candidatus Heimdallarchaeota archaeon]|nr:MAG: hypothetical protein JSV04_06400 [Candidatus Heimdallarchaeota archaeon]
MSTSETNPNRHELILFDPHEDPRILSNLITNEVTLETQPIFVDFDPHKVGLSKNICRKSKYISLPKSFYQDSPTHVELWRLLKDFRLKIWEGIKNYAREAFFLIDFHSKRPTRESALTIEKFLYRAFHAFLGFQLKCMCLYGMDNSIEDFLDIVPLHTDVRVQCESRISLQSWPISPYHVPRGISLLNEKNHTNTLDWVAEQAFADTNDPFIFRSVEGEVVGMATNLTNLIYQLERVPIEVACYHIFRKTGHDLQGKPITLIERSDLALWVEYTLGDTTLAQQIYDIAKKTIGYYADPQFATITAQRNTLESVLQLLESRRATFLSHYL